MQSIFAACVGHYSPSEVPEVLTLAQAPLVA